MNLGWIPDGACLSVHGCESKIDVCKAGGGKGKEAVQQIPRMTEKSNTTTMSVLFTHLSKKNPFLVNDYDYATP